MEITHDFHINGGKMKVEVIGIAKDVRTNTPVVYAKIDIPDYLELVGKDFESFTIQRRREKHKFYTRMKTDLVNGALLPSITLAVKPEHIPELIPFLETNNFTELSKALAVPEKVNILDGLQRTYILMDMAKDGVQFKEGQTIFVEFWIEEKLEHLIYRIIVLNAGQKPMSTRHQIELLFMTLKTKIEETVAGLTLFTERDGARRTSAKKYSLDRVVTAYQAYITKSSEVQRDNIVAQMLAESDVFDANEAELLEIFNSYLKYLGDYSKLDEEICRIYVTQNPEKNIPTGTNWFGSENVMTSFFAAIAQLRRNEIYHQRITNAIEALKGTLQPSAVGTDPLDLETLHAIIDGFNPRRINVGLATRRLLTNGFKEFLREEGGTSFHDCWIRASE